MRHLFAPLRIAAIFLAAIAPAFAQSEPDSLHKLGPLARARALAATGWSRVIITAPDAAALDRVIPAIQDVGGIAGRALPIIDGRVASVPSGLLTALANHPDVSRVMLDREVGAAMERTGATVGATFVREQFDLTGAGVAVAVIDSGITSWHDDLSAATGGQRVAQFVDFVNGGIAPYDDHGHGTHVAGIIAGNGFDSDGHRTGIAPAADLVALKVLDATGRGHISDVIAAFDYVVANRDALNIRVVNLSIAAGVYESYDIDPLTLAAKRAVEAGIVVVAPAGNAGNGSSGRVQYGGTTAPGNAPWVLTVGASSHMGTIDRGDDTIASFSSRGPTAVDYTAKPDVVAPGVGIESLSAFASTLYTDLPQYLLNGTVEAPYVPYLSLSGTSMASPVVAGAVAVMLQANPALTPNQVKAILQYTAQKYTGYDALTQGAGFLNVKGAIQLARYFADPEGEYPTTDDWSQTLVWGTRAVRGGRITPDANAWTAGVAWGSVATPDAQDVEWGIVCAEEPCDTSAWAPWGLAANAGVVENVVWGLSCGGSDCTGPWSVMEVGGALTTESDGDTVVWGTSDDADTVVWGTSDEDTVVWGTSCTGTCAPVLWNEP